MFRNIMMTVLAAALSVFALTAFAEETSVTTTTSTNPATGTTTVVEKKTIITPAPKSVSCSTVAAHWEGTVWVDTQTRCKYEGRAEGVEWIQDYWACINFTDDGNCTSWEYKPGYWVKTSM